MAELVYQIGKSNLNPTKKGEYIIEKLSMMPKGYHGDRWEPFAVVGDTIWWRRKPLKN